MVRCFNFEAHFFQCQHDITTAVLTKIHRRQIEVTTLVIQFGCWVALVICFEQEEFRFWSNVHRRIAHFLSLLQSVLQNRAWVASERRTIWHINVANQTSNFAFCNPWENNPCI
ncbi:hypothetical protein D3C85_1415900 [compost metagenome]